MTFTTRPEIKGTFGVCTSTHWIASAVGMKLLEAGGTAFDAAAGTAFALHVVEPHLNGPLGEVPALIRLAGEDAPRVVCGQGVAPAAATIAYYRAEGLDMVPGSGPLAAVVPGAFDAWMMILRDHGRLELRDVLEPAIHYARNGHPVLPRVSAAIAGLSDFFREEWPTSFETWLPGGKAPAPWSLFRNPALADTWERLLAEAEAVTGREARIEAARRIFREGFVAEAVDRFVREARVMDSSGRRRRGVLTGADMAAFEATYEEPLAIDYEGWTVWKCGPWAQGPVLLQCLRLLENSGIGHVDPRGADFVHRITETMKLAYADREAYYGDPKHTAIPVETLLSREHAEGRRALVGDSASTEQRPGRIEGLEAWAEAAVARAARTASEPVEGGVGTGEPTMAHLAEQPGDTVHIDVIDRWGNAISATPSGGWLQSSPVVPGLGMPLNTRGQMFWLEEGLPTSLAPGRRPRTTLTPSMARSPDGTDHAFGTPGGDSQDQWQLIFLLRLVHAGMNLQEAIDAPLFHTSHFQSSFYPREVRPAHLMVEPALGDAAIADLAARGHAVEVAEAWTVGRLTAACRTQGGVLKAAATPRLMQAYAVGR